MPNEVERSIIFGIHLSKKNRDPNNFDMGKLVDITEGYTGAEIEQVVIDGLYVAYGTHSELTTDILTGVIGETKPLSVINAKHLGNLRDWAKDRCRNASKRVEKPTTKKRGSGRQLKVEEV